MKKCFFILTILFCSVGLYATRPTTTANVTHPTTFSKVSVAQTNVTVSHPTTQTTVTYPTTQVSVTKPTTVTSVQHPTTQTAVFKPTTTGSVSHPITTQMVTRPQTPFGGTMGMNGSGSYTPSYKKSTKFTPIPTPGQANVPAADPGPKAAKLGSGRAGLGMGTDANAAEKDALAAQERQKAESSDVSAEDVAKKTKLPEGLADKLKQKAGEARKTAK